MIVSNKYCSIADTTVLCGAARRHGDGIMIDVVLVPGRYAVAGGGDGRVVQETAVFASSVATHFSEWPGEGAAARFITDLDRASREALVETILSACRTSWAAGVRQPGDLEWMATVLAEAAGREAEDLERRNGHATDRSCERAYQRGADDEFRFCMAQTREFLEDRMARVVIRRAS